MSIQRTKWWHVPNMLSVRSESDLKSFDGEAFGECAYVSIIKHSSWDTPSDMSLLSRIGNCFVSTRCSMAIPMTLRLFIVSMSVLLLICLFLCVYVFYCISLFNCVFLNGPIPASFCLFSLFSRYNFNNTNWKKFRWHAWDSNPGL